MSVSVEINSYFSGSGYESDYGPQSFSLKIKSDDGEMDPYAIGDEGDSRNRDDRRALKENGDSDQGTNDLMALMSYIAMMMAIFSQLFQQPQSQPDSEDQPGGKPDTSSKSNWVDPPPAGDTGNTGNDGNQPPGPPPVSRKQDAVDIRDDVHQPDPNPAPPKDPPKDPPETQDKPADKPPVDAVKNGVSPDSKQVVSTGTGTGHYFNVVNNTDRPQTFAFSSNSSNTSGYSNNINATMTLQPGETGTFESGSDVPGIRINSSGPNGETHGNEALYEDTVEKNPMGDGVVHNPDVSDVAGKVSYDGRAQKIAVSDGTRWIGDGTETGVYDYDVEDKDPNRATNPMNMALNPSNTYTIVFSDG